MQETNNQLQVFKAEFFRALAHPVRIRILEILSIGERSVQELQDTLQLDQPLVSQQLAVLRGEHCRCSKTRHDGQVRGSGSAGGRVAENRAAHL